MTGAATPLQASLLVRGARPPGRTGGAVDLRVVDGILADVAPGLARHPGEDVVDAGGRWAIPGLWDAHVHLGQWAASLGRLDLSGARSAVEALELVRAQLARTGHGGIVVAHGFRAAVWPDHPTRSALDAVAGDVPVVLISGDVHSGWLSSPARALLGVPVTAAEAGAATGAAADDGLLREEPWFAAMTRLGELPTGDETAFYRTALAGAAARGVVGVTDMELAANAALWPERVAAGLDTLRVRTATYADRLEEVIAAGLRTGQPLPGSRGLLTMGPLKVISDGSLSTRTAHCSAPYADPGEPGHPHGVQNVAPDVLVELLARAAGAGLHAAVHAIGDAAVDVALDAFTATGARGSVEHAQLLTPAQPVRMARLGVVASVQPAHLLDDREITEDIWPGRGDRCFPLRELADAGVRLAFGSDAPVAPLDPWLAMAAAVHRSADARPPWHPEHQLTAAEALAASTDGSALRPGEPGDVVLLDADPLQPFPTTAEVADHLRKMPVAMTVVAGRVVHDAT